MWLVARQTRFTDLQIALEIVSKCKVEEFGLFYPDEESSNATAASG